MYPRPPACRHSARSRAVLFGLLLALLLPGGRPAASETVRFDGVERVVAIGDVHGAHDQLLLLLRGTGLIDEAGAWHGGRAHLVMTGDLVDRGADSRAVLDLLMRLQQEAAAAGGAVHVLLGNHEVMTLTGDLRYVAPGEFAAFAGEGPEAPALPAGYLPRLHAFAPDGRYGRWLLERPVLVAINGDLFVHGGLSQRLDGRLLAALDAEARAGVRAFAEAWHRLLAAGVLQPQDDFDAILARARALSELAGEAAEAVPSADRQAAAAILAAIGSPAFQPDGPLWYRGSARCHAWAEAQTLEDVLVQGFGLQRVVVGHTPTEDGRIHSRVDGRVLRIDTGINVQAYGGRASALVIERGRTQAWYAGEGAAAPVVEAARIGALPHAMDDAAIEDFLRGAAVVAREPVGTGITQPERLTLERDGIRMRAVFKTLDTDRGLESPARRWRRSDDESDRFLYELAAYRLDRLLGLHMVPVAVERSIGGRRGVLQYWIEDAISALELRRAGRGYQGDCSAAGQYALMNAFDLLIHNTDRNLGNLLYDADWNVWLIDHSRAFTTELDPPPYLRDQEIGVPAPMKAAIAALDHDALVSTLSPYLHPRQIRALQQRAARWTGN